VSALPETSADAQFPASEMPSEAVTRHLSLMEDWIEGRRSFTNQFIGMTGDRAVELAQCAVADAQEVVKHAAAVQAYASLMGSGYTFTRDGN
jgi:hypothetical protein